MMPFENLSIENKKHQEEPLQKKLVNKLLSFYVLIRHGRVPLKYFYRHTYYCQLIQLKYWVKDYVTKKKYKTISFNGEFAPELQFVLPFAYWHFKNGTLQKTISAKHTAELYFFSPDHEEVFDSRIPLGNYNYDIPRVLYSHNYNMKKWLPVPLKETYKNDFFRYGKPLLIVANRYNKEWDGPPVSYFSIEILNFIFSKLQHHYTIIYNRPGAGHITMDNSDIYELGEYDWVRSHYPNVILMDSLYAENKPSAKNFNHFQLLVYASAEKFISIHGGTAALASYFGGTNLILSKKGPEHHFQCFEKLYPKLSGARIVHAKNDEELKKYVEELF